MERHYDTFESNLLERTVPYLWFGSVGRPLVMFPSAGGRFHENEDRGLVSSLGDLVAEGRLQICCIDSFSDESWNNTKLHPAEKVRRHDRYDRYLAEELLPLVTSRAGRNDTTLFGASLGAFFAVDFAARHPEQVARCIAFSGIFDCRRLLEGHWDDLCYFHCPVCFVPNMDAGWVERLARVEWVLATGEHDHFASETRNLSGIFRDKRVPVHSEIWPGEFGHDWPYWKEHLRRFVQ